MVGQWSLPADGSTSKGGGDTFKGRHYFNGLIIHRKLSLHRLKLQPCFYVLFAVVEH